MEIALFSAKEKGRMKKLSFFHTSIVIGEHLNRDLIDKCFAQRAKYYGEL
jgi:hypothetical protein